MYVDIDKSRLGNELKKILPTKENHLRIPINGNLEVRISQNKPDIVRVVMYNIPYKGVEFTSDNYEIKKYYNPFRIVMDVKGKAAKTATLPKIAKGNSTYAKKYTRPKKTDRIPKGAITKQLALGVSRIVIDPGHGGRDYGASGYYKGTYEKNIVLQLAKKLAAKLRSTHQYEVILTRTTDRFLTLEERTKFANDKHADLFISLHANAHRNKGAYGIETYFLNLATDDEAIRVAAKENATSKKNISDLQSILTDIMRNAKIDESSRLATHVQNAMYYNLKKNYDKINNKGVKQAPFYVLLGAKMPSILIETVFISNPRECKRVTNNTYQDRLCNAIISGIKKYIKKINAT